MTNSISRFSSDKAVLFGVLTAFVVLWLAAPQEFEASDSWQYSSRAFEISQNGTFGDNHVFGHRLAVTVPVALVYSALGVSIRTTNLWPLIAALFLVITVWLALPDKRSKLAGALLCLLSVPLVNSSLILHPDIIAATFMSLSSLVLFNRRKVLTSGRRSFWITAIVGVLCLFVAFLAKLSSYWVLPLWGLALLGDFKDNDRALLFRRFHYPALTAGLVLGVGYLLFCNTVWEDPLARFRNIETLAEHHLWSQEGGSAGELLKRLTLAPLRLLVAQYGPILVLALAGVILAPRSLRPWIHYTVFCIFFFWFGSTSFTRYEPMPLVQRMTLPALPGILVLASFAAGRVSISSDRRPGINALLSIMLVLGMIGLPFARYVSSWAERPLSEANAMCILRQEVESHPTKRYLLVCSDNRSPLSLSFYFSYRYPDNLRVTSAEALEKEFLRCDKRFVFVNSLRSARLESRYGYRHFDNEIAALGLPLVYESGGVALFTSEEENELGEIILPNMGGESDR